MHFGLNQLSLAWVGNRGGSAAPPPPPSWILVSGLWEDSGVWDDAAVWSDGA